MSEIKLLHISDLHLERKISHLTSKKSQIRKSELLLTFSNILERFNDAQLVLISGDLFDGDCSDSTISYVCNLFKEHSEKRFFIACGNHDHLNSSCIRSLITHKPDNAFVFGDSIDYVEIPGLSVRVYGISFSGASSYASLINGFKCVDDELLNLMVLHGDVLTDSAYNPISCEEILNSNLDYLALGHIHTFSGFNKRGNTYYAYPGVHEPCGFDETGDCGVIYGNISKEKFELKFYPVSKRKYHAFDFDISDFSSNEEVVRVLETLVNRTDLFRINFVGKRCFSAHFDTYQELLDCFHFDFCDNTQNYDSIINYSNEISLRGKTANNLLEKKDMYDEEIFNAACDILTEIMCKD